MDERVLIHQMKAMRIATRVGAVLIGALLLYRFCVEGYFDWQLFTAVAVMAVVKLLIDYGLITRETIDGTRYYRVYDYGMITYAPGTDPVLSYEQMLIDATVSDGPGLGDNRLELIGAGSSAHFRPFLVVASVSGNLI